LPEDEGLVEPFGLQIKWLLKFRRVDPQVPNFSAIFEKNGIPIVHALDSDEFASGNWSGGNQKFFAMFVAFKSATTGSTGQHAEENLN
jgi:hypothetical protein